MKAGRLVGLCMIVACLLLMFVQAGHAAKVHGAIYDREMNTLRKTVVYINTTPMQRHISKYGGYSFIVAPGNYVLVANLSINNVTRTIAQEHITIPDDGEYQIDLFAHHNINVSAWQSQEEADSGPFLWLGIVLLGIALIMAVVSVIFLRRRLEKTSEAVQSTRRQLHVQRSRRSGPDWLVKIPEPDRALARAIVQMLRNNEGQLPQKAIRKNVGFSEAKVSMVISSLESAGVVEKVRKGRSNHILYIM